MLSWWMVGECVDRGVVEGCREGIHWFFGRDAYRCCFVGGLEWSAVPLYYKHEKGLVVVEDVVVPYSH